MTSHRFFVPGPLEPRARGLLSEDQSRQAGRVLRLRQGDAITVFDGSGAELAAWIEEREGARWQFMAGELSNPLREPGLRLTVALALLRNERFDLAVQKLTELGVAQIVPLAAERCVVSYADARTWEKRRARLDRIIIEAAEQSERTTLPILRNPMQVRDFVKQYEEGPIIALVERCDQPHLSVLERADRTAILVGPEGGWSPGETSSFGQCSVHQAGLGKLILRAETAAIVAAGIMTQCPANLEARAR